MSRAVRAADGIWWMRTLLANVAFVGLERGVGARRRGGGRLQRVDCRGGRRAVRDRRGPDAIILTHGHFDHVGSLERLLDRWDVPGVRPPARVAVYHRALVVPATRPAGRWRRHGVVGEALSARAHRPRRARAAAARRTAACLGLPGWRWMHTPGHSPGHVSLVREADGAVIAGDAITTTKQESLISVADAAAGAARAARVLHARLVRGSPIRAGAGGARPVRARLGARHPDERPARCTMRWCGWPIDSSGTRCRHAAGTSAAPR